MIVRIPPSLNWLIKKYAYLRFELEQVEVRFSKIQEERNKVLDDLNALQKVMAMHDLSFPPEYIPPARKSRKILISKHGETTRLMYQALSTDTYISTEEVFLYICDALNLKFETSRERKEYRTAVWKRLKTLASNGKVERTKQVKGNALYIGGYLLLELINS